MFPVGRSCIRRVPLGNPVMSWTDGFCLAAAVLPACICICPSAASAASAPTDILDTTGLTVECSTASQRLAPGLPIAEYTECALRNRPARRTIAGITEAQRVWGESPHLHTSRAPSSHSRPLAETRGHIKSLPRTGQDNGAHSPTPRPRRSFASSSLSLGSTS